jgi:hypothetical protein
MEEVTEASERMELVDEENCSESGDEDNCGASLGNYWQDSYPGLKPMDMVMAESKWLSHNKLTWCEW